MEKENPIIEHMMRTGYPPGREPPPDPRCPECWSVCEKLYKDRNGNILGCDCCIVEVDAWEI